MIFLILGAAPIAIISYGLNRKPIEVGATPYYCKP